MENDRRHDNDSRDRLSEIHKGYLRFTRRAGIAIGIQAFVLIIGLGAITYLLNRTDENTNRIEVIALKADSKAERSTFLQELAQEKVCSQSSNRPYTCQALFERLYKDISAAQRRRLACSVFAQIDGTLKTQLLKQTRCP